MDNLCTCFKATNVKKEGIKTVEITWFACVDIPGYFQSLLPLADGWFGIFQNYKSATATQVKNTHNSMAFAGIVRKIKLFFSKITKYY